MLRKTFRKKLGRMSFCHYLTLKEFAEVLCFLPFFFPWEADRVPEDTNKKKKKFKPNPNKQTNLQYPKKNQTN